MTSERSKHSPAKLSTYVDTHNAIMGQFRSRDEIGQDTLELLRMGGQSILVGEIACIGNIVIQVFKILQYDAAQGMVHTVRYAYNVSYYNHGNLFRYDNQHPEFRYDGHADEHHKHVFPWPITTGAEGDVEWIGEEKWPTLGEVIQEAINWRASNLPDNFGMVESLQSAQEVVDRFGYAS